MSETLIWPQEAAKASSAKDGLPWSHAGSNLCLDFHGDPISARLVVFSDGNHHMALEQCLQAFIAQTPDVQDIFYATTPPGVLIEYLEQGSIWLGNLQLSRLPHIFISPPGSMDRLQQRGFIESHTLFMQSRGNVLLVRKGNPKNIECIKDILRADVRLFISNPETEKASYEVYRNTLVGLGQEAGLEPENIENKINDNKQCVHGERIHHREAPQCLFHNRADVALVYYHLALRYVRIFPDVFDLIPLSGTIDEPEFTPANICTKYHIGKIGNGGNWGQAFMDFMLSNKVTTIYSEHGLQRPSC